MKRTHKTKELPAWYPHFRMAYRAAALLLGAVLAARILTGLTFAILNPFVILHREAAGDAHDIQLVNTRRLEKKHLEERAAWLKSPQGAVEESRRKGMTKAGEYAVNFVIDPATQPAATPVAATPSPLGQLFWPGICLLALSFLAGSGWLLRQRNLARLRRPAGTLTPRTELQRRPQPKPPTRGTQRP